MAGKLTFREGQHEFGGQFACLVTKFRRCCEVRPELLALHKQTGVHLGKFSFQCIQLNMATVLLFFILGWLNHNPSWIYVTYLFVIYWYSLGHFNGGGIRSAVAPKYASYSEGYTHIAHSKIPWKMIICLIEGTVPTEIVLWPGKDHFQITIYLRLCFILKYRCWFNAYI